MDLFRNSVIKEAIKRMKSQLRERERKKSVCVCACACVYVNFIYIKFSKVGKSTYIQLYK